jgi:NAD+ diphosphatase
VSEAAQSPAAVADPAPLTLTGLALARGEVDRAAEHRADEAWLESAWADPGSRVLVVERGKAIVVLDGERASLVLVPPAQAPDGVRFLLGVDAGGVAYFGVAGALPEPAAAAGAGTEVRAAALREAGPLLADRDAGLMTHAVAVANFHDSHHFCPNCGAPSEPASAGHARRCTAEDIDEFPRVDPAMIVLVTDPQDRCLLARNAAWPQYRVSVLAGFVEAGESAEQAVAREVHEETGIAVASVRYLGSQPWPMPQSLMLGFQASATGSLEFHVDHEEIAEAGWYSRAELKEAVAEGTLRLPPPVSIAHQIITAWYGAELPAAW